MSVESKFTYKDGTELNYNLDWYDDANTEAIEFKDNFAKLKNINDNKISKNFFGRGRLGNKTISKDYLIDPTCCYFTEVVVGDSTYGTHIKGIFGEIGKFSVGDEIIMHKRHCSSKDYYDQIGKYDIGKIVDVVIDSDDNTLYILEEDPVNDYNPDETLNTATLILEYNSLFLQGQIRLNHQDDSNDTFKDRHKFNWRDYLTHPDKEVWKNRAIGNARGILYIKVKETFELAEDSQLINHVGYWGGKGYDPNVFTLDDDKVDHSHYILPTGWLPSASDGQARNDIISASDICDYVGYEKSGAGSFVMAGDAYSSKQFCCKQIDNDYYPSEKKESRKLFYGTSGGFHPSSAHTTFGSDGGGIIIVQARKIKIANNAFITAPSVQRRDTDDSYWSGCGTGGTVALKALEIDTQSDKPFVSTLMRYIDEDPTKEDNGDDDYDFAGRGYSNYGIVAMEFENITIGEEVIAYQDFVDNYDDNKGKVFLDYNVLEQIQENLTADILDRDADYDISIGDMATYINEPGTTFEEYEVDKYYKFYTKGYYNIETDLWSSVENISMVMEDVTDTDIRVLFSINGGDDWFKINVEEETAEDKGLDEIDTGNTVEEVTKLIPSYVYDNLLVQSSEDRTIDICIGLSTSKKYKTPRIQSFLMEYVKIAIPSAPIRILPANKAEFDAEYVDFVWIQPTQSNGSIQNRVEISESPVFTPEELVGKFSEDKYSTLLGEVVAPYISKDTEDGKAYLRNMVLPFMVDKQTAAKTDTDNYATSLVREGDNLNYYGDDWFIKGEIVTLPNNSIEVPDMTAEAPMCADQNLDNVVLNIKLAGLDNTDDIADANGTVDELDAVKLMPTSREYYSYGMLYGQSDSTLTGVIYNDNKHEHPLLKFEQEKTIHIKFTPFDLANGNGVLLRLVDSPGSTSYMCYIAIGRQSVTLRTGYTYSGGLDNYLFEEMFRDGVPSNITVTVNTDNEVVGIFVNGVRINQHTATTWNDESRMDEDDETNDIGFYLGGTHNASAYCVVDELTVFDTVLTDEKIMEISKLPVYHQRYDVNSGEYELVQFPYDIDNYIVTSEFQQNPDKIDYRDDMSHFYDRILATPLGGAYRSNNESLLIGSYIGGLEVNHAPAYIEDKHHILGLQFYTNNWNTVSDLLRETNVNSNNTIGKNTNSTKSLHYILPYRVNKLDTIVEADIIVNKYEFDTETTSVGIVYSRGSETSTAFAYEFLIEKNIDTSGYRLTIGYDNSNKVFVKDIRTLLEGERVLLKVQALNNDFRDIVEVTIESIEGYTYPTETVIFNSEKDGYHFPHNMGYHSDDYEDMTYSYENDYNDVGFSIRDALGDFSVAGLVTYKSVDDISVQNGHVDKYYTQQRLLKDSTTNIISMDVTTENETSDAYVRCVISFDDGVTWKKYSYDDGEFNDVDITDDDAIKDSMTTNDLFAITSNIAVAGGFTSEANTYIRTYLLNEDAKSTAKVTNSLIKFNGPRIIDSWKESGNYYDGHYTWYYLNDNSWNPFLPVDTGDDSDQNWTENGTGIPSPIEFVEGNGSKPSQNGKKCYGYCRIDCLPKGKWYWRIAAYNGIKK